MRRGQVRLESKGERAVLWLEWGTVGSRRWLVCMSTQALDS